MTHHTPRHRWRARRVVDSSRVQRARQFGRNFGQNFGPNGANIGENVAGTTTDITLSLERLLQFGVAPVVGAGLAASSRVAGRTARAVAREFYRRGDVYGGLASSVAGIGLGYYFVHNGVADRNYFEAGFGAVIAVAGAYPLRVLRQDMLKKRQI